ncbi:MAG: ATP-binding protein [Ignavibacteria bacterium]|jgi:serine/threonine-protein kinase RsbW|nr:ATP-binding protein [Ignavibacteria bacterium]
MEETIYIHKTLASDKNAVKIIEPLIWDIKNSLSLTDERIYNILIAVTEAINNAVSHGNKYDTTKKVEFSIRVIENEIIFVVIDEGSGFNPENVPDPRDPNNLFREGGRGVFLIQQLSDEAFFSDNGRQLTMKFFINKQS